MSTSRTKKSIQNSTVALIYYAVALILSFFSRKIFLDYLGTDILGLNTTAQNLLQFLNLAELGIGSAVGFSLYKPIHDNDHETINEIVTLQGHLYKRIAWTILGGSIILMAFFPLIFKKITLPLWYAYASFGVFLFSALLGYFFNYKQILLTSSQNDYKIQYSYRTVIIIKILVQMWAVYNLPNGYVWWLVCEVVFSAIASYTLHLTTIKEFPGLKSAKESFKNLRTKYKPIVIKIKQLFFHKIGGFVLTQTSPLIIYALIDLQVVAYYGNYMIIISGIQILMSSIFNSMGAGIGNLVAEGNEPKIRKVFEELFSVRFVISATLCFCLIILTAPFVKLWIGAEYILPMSTLIILVSILFINMTRYSVESYVNAYGLYGDIWAPVIEAVLNLSLSFVFGSIWGLNGILMGVLASLIIIPSIWRPYYLISREMKGFMSKYIWIYFSHLGVGIGVGLLLWYMFGKLIEISYLSYINFIWVGCIAFAIYFMLTTFFLCLISPGMRDGISRFKTLFAKFLLK